MPIVAKVAVLQRFPRDKGVFDYIIQSNLSVQLGDLVEVPFRNKKNLGIVLSVGLVQKSSYNLKPIVQVVLPLAINKHQLALLNWLSESTGVSSSVMTKFITKAIPTKKISLSDSPLNRKRSLNKNSKPVNIITLSTSLKERVVNDFVKRVIQRGEQVLLLVPEVSLIALWQKKLTKIAESVTFSGNGKISDLRTSWLRIRNNDSQVIIGTRSALWLNYPRLGAIIIDQAESESYLQTEQNPRYDAIEAAQLLARFYQASLAKVAAAPRLEYWQASNEGHERWQELSVIHPPIKIVNLQKRSAKDQGLLSDEAIKLISSTLEKKGRVLLYLNRRGEATGSVCHDCGFSPVCSRCQKRLALVEASSSLICFHCGHKQPAPIPCPECSGTQINYYGGGTTKLANEVKKLWPNYQSVLIHGQFKNSYIKAASEASIVLGSRTAIRALAFGQLDLAVLVSLDGELVLPEFRSAERSWQLIRNLMSQSRQLLIQTQIPDHYLWKIIASNKTADFYEKEIAIRQQYVYPPIVKLVRFIFTDINEELAKKQAKAIYELLLEHLPKAVILVGPYPDYYHIKGTKWRYNLLLKYTRSFNPNILWQYLPEDVIVERNPWLIFS